MVGYCFIQSLFSNVNKSIKIFLQFILMIGFAFAQETEKTTLQISDSTKISNHISSISNLQIKYNEFEIYRDLNRMRINIELDDDPNTLWLRTSFIISNTSNSTPEFNPNFLSPLERKYQEDSKFDPVRYVLGAAQVGAVGYLAYKHIKKYGFLK